MKKNGFLLLVSKMKKNGFLLIEIMIFLGVMSIFFITISQYFTTLLITYENSNKKIEAFNKASKILNSLLQNYDDSVNSKDTIISEVSSGIKLPAIFVNNNKTDIDLIN